MNSTADYHTVARKLSLNIPEAVPTSELQYPVQITARNAGTVVASAL